MGAPLALRSPKLAGLRKWVVSGFENVLIFYLPCPGGVSIRARIACRAGLVAPSWNPMSTEPILPLCPPASVSCGAVHADAEGCEGVYRNCAHATLNGRILKNTYRFIVENFAGDVRGSASASEPGRQGTPQGAVGSVISEQA